MMISFFNKKDLDKAPSCKLEPVKEVFINKILFFAQAAGLFIFIQMSIFLMVFMIRLRLIGLAKNEAKIYFMIISTFCNIQASLILLSLIELIQGCTCITHKTTVV